MQDENEACKRVIFSSLSVMPKDLPDKHNFGTLVISGIGLAPVLTTVDSACIFNLALRFRLACTVT